MKKYTFGKTLVITFTNNDDIVELHIANKPYEDIIYTIANLTDINSINFKFLTEDHRKDFLETDVFGLFEEIYLQKRAISKIMDKHQTFDDYKLKWFNNDDNIDLFEKELFLFFSSWQ